MRISCPTSPCNVNSLSTELYIFIFTITSWQETQSQLTVWTGDDLICQQSKSAQLWRRVLVASMFFTTNCTAHCVAILYRDVWAHVHWTHYGITETNCAQWLSAWIVSFTAYQRSGTQNTQHRPHKQVHTWFTHTHTHWALGSDERRSQFNTILLSCPQARLQTEPAADRLAVISTARSHTNTHILSPCYTAEALLEAYKHTYIHRPAFYFQNTQWNDSSSPTGGFTDSTDRVT